MIRKLAIMDALDHLFLLSEAYCAHTGLAEGTVSARVLGGGNRIRDLRARSTDIGVYRLKEAIRWFGENWPDGAEWPDAVPRPVPVPSAPQQSPEAA